MPVEIDPKLTTRAAAWELWMNAPNPMVTFFKTLDVTGLVRFSRKHKLRFNMLMDFAWAGRPHQLRSFILSP